VIKRAEKGDLRTRVSENESEILSMPFLVFDPFVRGGRKAARKSVNAMFVSEQLKSHSSGIKMVM
jgi:hypothetical protein